MNIYCWHLSLNIGKTRSISSGTRDRKSTTTSNVALANLERILSAFLKSPITTSTPSGTFLLFDPRFMMVILYPFSRACLKTAVLRVPVPPRRRTDLFSMTKYFFFYHIYLVQYELTFLGAASNKENDYS